MKTLVFGVLLLLMYLLLTRKREHLFSGWCNWIGLPTTFCYLIDPCNYIPRMSYTQWIRDYICGQGGCPDGKVKEGGLCYDPCKDGFGSDGATMCWKRYSEFPGAQGGWLNVPTLTKASKSVTGSPISECDENDERNGALCYPKCKNGMRGDGPMCWNDVFGVGIGKPMS